MLVRVVVKLLRRSHVACSKDVARQAARGPWFCKGGATRKLHRV
jgi:hypothetical protein